MARFNVQTNTKTTNLAGGKSYSMNKEMELIHAVLTTFLENKFYESGNERLERIKQLVAINKPEFVANLAVIARKEFNLRSVTTVLLGELSRNHNGDDLVKRAIVEAVVRPDDVTELVSYLGKPLPKQVKRGVRNAILKFNRYQLAKYRSDKKGVSIVDVLNMVHPNPKHANDEQKQAWADLIKGKLSSFDTWEKEISASTEEDRTNKWETLVLDNKLGYMALLRNLNNLVRNDVSEDVIDKAIEKITNSEEVKRSKQLPFRFVTAYENVRENRKLLDAISIAMDHAVSNTPELPGKTLIAVDSSGSMVGEPIAKASIFGATLMKANVSADVIMYDTEVKTLQIGSRVPVIDIAENIKRNLMGGGTQTSLVFQYAMGKKYDRIIIISDNESWAEGYWGGNVNEEYNRYKSEGNDPFVYAIDIEGYGTKDVEGGKVFHLTGWSNRLLDFIGNIEKGENLTKYVKNYKIK